jgi:hypothetical protein
MFVGGNQKAGHFGDEKSASRVSVEGNEPRSGPAVEWSGNFG